MGPEKSEKMKCEVVVSLFSDTPVVGCEINPSVRVQTPGTLQPPQHSLIFSWYREQITCSVHQFELATIQCMPCVSLSIPVKESYHCSTKCFLNTWQRHLAHHREVAETVNKTKSGVQQAPRKLRSCGSWPEFGRGSLFDGSSTAVEREGKVWVKVGSSKTYEPSMDDAGFSLRLEFVAVDPMGTQLSPTKIIVTEPVILFPPQCPRCMINIRGYQKSWNVNFKVQSLDDITFTVLSYNILSDLYASRDMHGHCPTWALAWEYRRQNLLREIMEYNADIICLQEVQSDHFESFFKPELTKCGYSVLYKKKTKEVYTANNYIIDGCATFFRCDLFKEIMKYELEFDKAALSVVDALEPGLKSQGRIRLLKDNVALVVVLEALKSGSTYRAIQSRICVANTHIHANSNFPDAKLCQVANLVNGLEKIVQSQVPVLICGDLNSVPESDPHRFLVRGKCPCLQGKKETDPLGIYRLLKLDHKLPLVSAYASFFRSKGVKEHQLRKMDPKNCEPRFTNFSPGFSGTLDYILYTADTLRVEGLLELLDKETVGVGLPSPIWSSDHIALMARFRLKPPSPKKSHPPPLPLNPWVQAAAR
ncbi:Exo_endo_phos domain-containing protein [Cephalotus follicularis]|uniref:poly(A)-specific ribonuclease n=1 Tax=Cephalotus follicularis TaxID=3775 RepID=A0A1Q3AU48_CEPFO|nr:Exo_endo_phos domain-containing protein [Cephalotus follicularis]